MERSPAFVSSKKQVTAPQRGILSALLFLAVFLGIFVIFVIPMGLSNALNTMMNTAYQLLVDTALYIMAIAVLA